MSVRFILPLPVSEVPRIVVIAYAIVELANGEYRVCGFRQDNGLGRVSAPIVSFAATSRLAQTASGRHYQLEGLPGGTATAHLAEVWCRASGAALVRDATEEWLGGSV